MEESRLAHEKEVARIKRKRKEMRKYIEIGTSIVLGWVFCMVLIWGFVWIVDNAGG